VYERKVVAEIRTRSDRQEAFPALERDQSVRSGSFMRQALRGDIFMVRSLCIMLLLPCRAVCLCSCFRAALCACAPASLPRCVLVLLLPCRAVCLCACAS
jgi:hypothetical protein